MLHRLAISMGHKEFKHVQVLQKRFGIHSRSEFFRELVARYEKLEHELDALNQSIAGYIKLPEQVGDHEAAFLKAGLEGMVHEKW